MNHNRGLKVTITDEGKDLVKDIIIGCVKVIVASILTKEESFDLRNID